MCVGRLVKVCVTQEHLEWGSVESSPDNHQLLVIPSFGSLCSWAGGLGLWRGAGALVLCSQLCLSCSTNCVIEKLFHFFSPPFTNTVRFVLQHQRPGAGRNNGCLQELQGNNGHTWPREESEHLEEQKELLV